jgi:hypothetical protein
MKGGLHLVGSLGLSCLGCSSRGSSNKFFPTVNGFNSFVPIAQQGGQAVVLGPLPLSMCLYSLVMLVLSETKASL